MRIEGDSEQQTEDPFRETFMHLYSLQKAYPQPVLASARPSSLRPLPGAPDIEPLSFVVDLNDLGLRDAYRAHEILRGSQCAVFAKVGPEYVNPWSGAREQASWIL